jgi:hypothetical protein
MSVPKMVCDRKTHDKLGEDGLIKVRSWLYAADCQTCGRPLGTDAPAVDGGPGTSRGHAWPRWQDERRRR